MQRNKNNTINNSTVMPTFIVVKKIDAWVGLKQVTLCFSNEQAFLYNFKLSRLSNSEAAL